MVKISVVLTPGQVERFRQLGGSAWLRQQLGQVIEPGSPGEPGQLDLLDGHGSHEE